MSEIICRCSLCNAEFHFDRSEFKPRDTIGTTVMGDLMTCPNCNMETPTYITAPVRPVAKAAKTNPKVWIYAALGVALAVTLMAGAAKAFRESRDADAVASSLLMIILFGLGCAFGFAVYFAPTYVGRHKKNFNAILMLNIFLGWTFLGWVVALVWACTKDE